MEEIERIVDFDEFIQNYDVQQEIEQNGFYIGLLNKDQQKNAVLIGHVENNGVKLEVFFKGNGKFVAK